MIDYDIFVIIKDTTRNSKIKRNKDYSQLID